MVGDSFFDLNLSERVDILYQLIRGGEISELVDRLDNRGVSGFQKYVWEKTVEFGIVCRGKNFDRKEVTRRMTPTSVFQLQQRCNQNVYNCKGTECLHTNPKCARKKIKEHVDVMAETIREYIQIVKKRELN
jgi:hypothetical protein